jgi:hypothetical protein
MEGWRLMWREQLHPRDGEGQFARKPGAKLARKLAEEWRGGGAPPSLDAVRKRHADVHLDVTEREGILTLSLIKVSDENRGGGKAEAALRDLTAYADAKGLTIGATPSADFGASKGRLTAWYKRHGFVPNKGRAKDYRVRETMIRPPKAGG